MLLKPPAFWYRKPAAHAAARMLKPFATLYGFETQRRLNHITPTRSALPVICIGNITLGGVGKTPFALALSGLLKSTGYIPNFLTRGYGGREKGPIRVDPARHSARDTGDEALLLARQGATWVSTDRVAGAHAIHNVRHDQEENDSDPPEQHHRDGSPRERSQRNGGGHGKTRHVIVMDDGFQNPRLHKDISILMIDATNPFGNGLIFPAGPLREHPHQAKGRADILAFVKPSQNYPVSDHLAEFAGDTPCFECWHETLTSDRLKNLPRDQKFIAFCGIGTPDRFFTSCTAADLDLVDKISFPDHYPYRDRDMDRLIAKARSQKAALITTRKDFIRLKPAYQNQVHVLDIETKIADANGFIAALEALIPASDPTAETNTP